MSNIDMNGSGLGGGDLPLNIPQPKKARMPSQVPLLLVILGISAISLYSMRKYGMQTGYTFTEVATDITEHDSEKARTYERIMADLSRVQNPLDVTLTQFGNSPFMRARGETIVTPDAVMHVEGQTDAERRKAVAVDTLKRMKLRGIIGNIARIDDLTVRVGDTVADQFLVTSIEGRTVTFEFEGDVYTLSLEERKGDQRKLAPTRMGTGSLPR